MTEDLVCPSVKRPVVQRRCWREVAGETVRSRTVSNSLVHGAKRLSLVWQPSTRVRSARGVSTAGRWKLKVAGGDRNAKLVFDGVGTLVTFCPPPTLPLPVGQAWSARSARSARQAAGEVNLPLPPCRGQRRCWRRCWRRPRPPAGRSAAARSATPPGPASLTAAMICAVNISSF